MITPPHPDGLAAMLLCSTVALSPDGPAAAKPLSTALWRSLMEKLHPSPWLEPGDLLGRSAGEIAKTLAVKPESAERIARLLDRGEQIAIELERHAAGGIWVITEFDEAYPTGLSQRLAKEAPPVLFGAGPMDLHSRDSIALVGSRDLDPDGEAFARAFASRCATEGVGVVSGGDRGVDRLSIIVALEAGGTIVRVPADSLQQTLRDGDTARLIRDGQLTLITPLDPAAGCSTGNAMACNKLIYGLARVAVVVTSDAKSGGTWAGATENLKRGWTPLFVRTGEAIPEGNRRLIQDGGHPIAIDDLPDEGHLLDGLIERAQSSSPATAPLLPQAPQAPRTGDIETVTSAARDLFEMNWACIAPFVLEPRTEQDVAEAFGLERAQARRWLLRAVEEGRAELISRSPRRFQQMRPRLL